MYRKDNFEKQKNLPLLEALQHYAQQPDFPFYTPGHKRGQGISPLLKQLLGTELFQADLPELPGLDNLQSPQGPIQAAQELAAEAFGAEQTWFLANGSTCGITAAILATCCPGDRILLPRNVHQSVISGLILSGAEPVFVQPEYDAERDLIYSLTPTAVSQALQQIPRIKAVLMVYPTYQGICGDIQTISEIAHHHQIPLLVDEAHGPHFAFHPDLPLSALAAGADLSVQSTHKVLSALTQASLLHVQGHRIDRDRLSQALRLVQSTSPSYLLLASLDAARHQIATQGRELLDQTLQLAETAIAQISELPGLQVLQRPEPPTPGFQTLDRTRLTVTVTDLGLTGFDADEQLQQFRVMAELPTLRHLTFILSLGNRDADVVQLVEGLAQLMPQSAPGVTRTLPIPPPPPTQIFSSPRSAFFADFETVSIDQAVDRYAAETLCPYPPGIPVIFPGEQITPAALDYLTQILAAGGCISGCSDPTLKTLRVMS